MPRGGYACLCIEMKTEKGRLSPEQKAWQQLAEEAGNRYVVCRSFEQFQEIVNGYLRRGVITSDEINQQCNTFKTTTTPWQR